MLNSGGKPRIPNRSSALPATMRSIRFRRPAAAAADSALRFSNSLRSGGASAYSSSQRRVRRAWSARGPVNSVASSPAKNQRQCDGSRTWPERPSAGPAASSNRRRAASSRSAASRRAASSPARSGTRSRTCRQASTSSRAAPSASGFRETATTTAGPAAARRRDSLARCLRPRRPPAAGRPRPGRRKVPEDEEQDPVGGGGFGERFVEGVRRGEARLEPAERPVRTLCSRATGAGVR